MHHSQDVTNLRLSEKILHAVKEKHYATTERVSSSPLINKIKQSLITEPSSDGQK